MLAMTIAIHFSWLGNFYRVQATSDKRQQQITQQSIAEMKYQFRVKRNGEERNYRCTGNAANQSSV